jgi:hypothetical protein
METPITKLRNLMGPIANYFAMKSDMAYSEESLRLMARELQRCQEVIPHIREILGSIPDDACEARKMKLWEIDFEPLWPVGHCLIVLAETEEEALTYVSEPRISIKSVKEIPMSKPGIVVYMSGDY